MTTILKNVIVDKISLVTNKEKPAVKKSTTKFALFKTTGKVVDNERKKKIACSIKKLADMTL